MVDKIVDTAEEVIGDLSQLEKDLSQAVQSRKTATAADQKTQQKPDESNDSDESNSVDSKLPPKLRGKTPEQIAEMYVNLESAYGRMANDLGTQRKMTDRLLDLKRDNDLSNNGAPQKVEIKSNELLENPTAALERFSQSRDAQNEQRLQEMESRLAAQQLMIAHPDYVEVAQSPDFAAWVQASPIRVRAVRAAQNGDWSAAGDLLSEFKAAKPAGRADNTAATDDEDQNPREAAKKASLESSSASNASAKKGKTYRRADLMRLRAERPDIWDDPAFQNEILIAYREKRVK